jgi:hypothetical protein
LFEPQITDDALRAVHLGERLDEGVVTWSGNTKDKTLALITAKTSDAVTTFLDRDYVEDALRAIERDAGHPLADAQEAVRIVSQRLRFTDAQQADIPTDFIRGGDVTAGGIMQAVTSVAQRLPDADTAHEMESAALRALDLAAGTGRRGPAGRDLHQDRRRTRRPDHHPRRPRLHPAGGGAA